MRVAWLFIKRCIVKRWTYLPGLAIYIALPSKLTATAYARRLDRLSNVRQITERETIECLPPLTI